ncbi:phosphate ABC transporter substrate-binding protein [Crocosphaera sp. XPORK-15E]|uniref:phosphate ABC transporter substrate-binding protein n=1 Tax=Crocosphaera sp. XPORK-15E TaxID=3110247 RepID=UPI002B1EC255|nr:phosphate ABC transporter substrate-binding protein [Crocosphaera sp. XPORK-15E]MEA5536556.1 phosphate ABC transporter substrate-binding protein [Crocosphaera sp. XPORK-15E]
MTQKKETLITIVSLMITLGILGGGYWWFTHQNQGNLNNVLSSPTSDNQPATSDRPLPKPPSPPSVTAFSPPTNVPKGTTVKIDGSTSMVLINQALKNRFEQQFPGTQVMTNAQGSTKGIQGLLEARIDLAAISRPLTAQEQQQGLVAIPIAQDAIAVVVGVNNPFRKGLTMMQVKDIFQGKITNWSELGRSPDTIEVINRPSVSGTRQTFAELVLNGENFGNTPNITTLDHDATTPILQRLGMNGISYATYAQVTDQQTVRSLSIDGLTPEASTYPYQRTLFYTYKNPPSEVVKVFLGYATSPTGQQVIQDAQ